MTTKTYVREGATGKFAADTNTEASLTAPLTTWLDGEQARGSTAETRRGRERAAAALIEAGHEMIEQSAKGHDGKYIDLITRDGQTIVFTTVVCGRPNPHRDALDNLGYIDLVDLSKRRKRWVEANPYLIDGHSGTRIDAVSVIGERGADKPAVTHRTKVYG